MAPWTATGAGCRSARARTCTSATGPGYPPAAIAWLLGPSPLRVLDVGAGTGKLTRALLAAGHDVVAVEPDPGMRAAFAAALPETEILEGAAEELPVAAGSFDAVAAGQSFHWFDSHVRCPRSRASCGPAGCSP